MFFGGFNSGEEVLTGNVTDDFLPSRLEKVMGREHFVIKIIICPARPGGADASSCKILGEKFAVMNRFNELKTNFFECGYRKP